MAQLDGVRLLGTRTVDFMTADHLGDIPAAPACCRPATVLAWALRCAHAGVSRAGLGGMYYWGGIAGTTFFVDPAEDFFGMLMIQAPNQRDYYRQLFRNLVYAALVD